VNAGHNPPLLRRKQDGNVFRPLRMKRNFALAVLEDWQYGQDEVQLDKDDVLFLYTDGVTEAENEERIMYSQERLTSFLNGETAGRAGSMVELLSSVWAELGGFVGRSEQSDDITMLAITYGSAKKISNSL
jgi:sigma-B regulation protein RsbU (phosphoserine phosphatase)